MALNRKKLVYPFTYEQWFKHPSTKPKLKWCKEVGSKIDSEKKYGKQLKLI
jgi:hypothetical protein